MLKAHLSRINKEIKEFQSEPLNGINLSADDEDIHKWKGQLEGPEGTPYYGYISNLRIGNTAVYSGTSYTVPTAQLTAITGTTLLASQSNRFVDNSPNNLALTVNGTPSVQKFSPFSSTVVSKNYSTYFNGSSDYLQYPSDTAFQFGTGNFTFEMWVYPTTTTKAMTIVDTRSGSGSTTGLVPFEMSATGNVIVSIGGSQLFTSSSALTGNTWTHLAVVRSGTNVTLYINGTKPTTGNGTSAAIVSDNFLTVGTSSGSKDTTTTNHFQGYIDDLRITKGYARYVANFTVPTITFPGL